jgi:hypothetical protein
MTNAPSSYVHFIDSSRRQRYTVTGVRKSAKW